MGYLDSKGLERYSWNIRNKMAGNVQMTKAASIVSFCPASESNLEPIVNFKFNETLPVTGEKGPNNPSTITGISEVKVARCGKNLLPTNFRIAGNANFQFDEESGKIAITGTTDSTGGSCYFQSKNGFDNILEGEIFKRGKTYTLSNTTIGNLISNYPMFRLFTKASSNENWVLSVEVRSGQSKTFTIPDDVYACLLRIDLNFNESYECESYVQIEEGSTATEFEKPEHSIYTVSLDNTYYGGSVNFATGEMTVTWRGMVLTGTEAWFGSTEHGEYYRYAIGNIPKVDNYKLRYCTHYPLLGSFEYDTLHFLPQGTYLYFFTTQTTLEDWKAWLAAQYANNTPVIVVYKLITPQTIQLDPIQIKALYSSDKYNQRLNTIYTDQESVQVGWIRENLVSLTENETISGLKTFKNTATGHATGDTVTNLIVRNPEVTRGIPLESGRSYTSIILADNEGDTEETFAGRLGLLEVMSPKENDTFGEELRLGCYRYSNDAIDLGKNSMFCVGYDKDGNSYSTAPETSSKRINSTDIVTRGFMEDSEWNWQKTQKKFLVQFKPIPESSLESVVNFMFTEIPPAEGEKSPSNPSTITGISSVNVTRCGKNLERTYNTNTINYVTVTNNNDGTYTVNGTATADTYFTFTGSIIPCKLGEKYTISGITNGSNSTYRLTLQCYGNQGNFVNGIVAYSGSATLTCESDGYLTSSLFVKSGVTLDNVIISPQIDYGEIASSFESPIYTDYIISLDNTYYGGSIDVSTGIMTVTHKIEELTGTENWIREYDNPYSEGTYSFRYAHSRYSRKSDPTSSNAWCTHCTKFVESGPATSSMEHIPSSFIMWASAGAVVFFYNSSNVNDFKAWLAAEKTAGHPVKVVFEMATPYTVQLTPTQIQSLPSLDKYSPRINTIYTDASSVQVGYQRYIDENNFDNFVDKESIIPDEEIDEAFAE